jgi:SAM-dependent methyltransferase
MDNFEAYSKYYEALYKDKNYEQEALYVIQLINSLKPGVKKLIELGCGTGKHAEIFCRNGFLVTGLERSPQMVRIAKAKSIKNFRPLVSDIATYSLNEKFEVAISLFHVVSYLTSNEMVLSCFKATSEHLEKGGLFIFDVWYSPAVYYQQPTIKIKRLELDNLKIIRLAEPVTHFNKNIVDVHYEVIIKDQVTSITEVLNEVHPMRHFSWPEIELFALISGFKLIHTEEFGTGKQPDKDTWGVCFILQKI